jgi:cytochrome c5
MCSLRNVALAIGVIACAGAGLTAQEAAQLVQMRCTVCHQTDLLQQQRLTREGWDREVAKMMGWGAAIDRARAADVAAYLAETYPSPGPAHVAVSSASGAAADLLKTRCTVCHRTDLIEAQRLDADGWRRELAKMMGWGAVLTPAERDVVLDYLASAAGERR